MKADTTHMYTRFADMGAGPAPEYFDQPTLMKFLSIAALRFRDAWSMLDEATQEAKRQLPDEYDKIAFAALETWKVWQSFEKTAAYIENAFLMNEQDNAKGKPDETSQPLGQTGRLAH